MSEQYSWKQGDPPVVIRTGAPMTQDHDRLREAIKWARGELENFTERPIHNVEAAAKTKLLIDAAESTLPRTRMVEVWHCECAFMPNDTWQPSVNAYSSQEAAELRARELRNSCKNGQEPYRCIRVTGPHQQEVPA